MGDSGSEMKENEDGSPDEGVEGLQERVAATQELDAMHQERRRTFVAALRSGRFKQARNVLQRVDVLDPSNSGFCCLGVACEVAIEGGLELERGHGGNCVSYVGAVGGSTTSLPPGVKRWYGFTSDNPHLKIPKEAALKAPAVFADLWEQCGERTGENPPMFTASSLNDVCKLSLELIGDCFEATFLPEDWEARHAQD
jgi:hypothetical protein